ncbi:MAG TPA: PaaI family thioesterase [Blastocatellia bacterium]|nr:PaaI family thioesterase [Blastocatellia bacterium]
MKPYELEEFLKTQFPQMDNYHFRVERLENKHLRLRLLYRDLHLRPGGTISGPALMTLADTAVYLLTLAHIGPIALAVTTNLNINFLRKPEPKDVIAETKLLKLGQRLAVGEVQMFSDGEAEVVAHATVTYSIPPK